MSVLKYLKFKEDFAIKTDAKKRFITVLTQEIEIKLRNIRCLFFAQAGSERSQETKKRDRSQITCCSFSSEDFQVVYKDMF